MNCLNTYENIRPKDGMNVYLSRVFRVRQHPIVDPSQDGLHYVSPLLEQPTNQLFVVER
jgi:hypothetical protein